MFDDVFWSEKAIKVVTFITYSLAATRRWHYTYPTFAVNFLN